MDKTITSVYYYPSALEFSFLVLVMFTLLFAGFLWKADMIDRHRYMPVKWAFVMLFIGSIVIGLLTSILLSRAESARTLPVLFSCFVFAMPPMFFFIKTVMDALSEQANQRLSPMGTKIEDTGEFNAARKLAQKGDVDGAVTLYRGYRENRSGALLEAARLLRTEERYADAVNMFQEISERYTENKVIWAEATYSLAKIMETNLGQPIGAMQYLQQIRKRAPDTKFSQMANSDLNRLQVMTGTRLENTEGAAEEKEAVGANLLTKIQIPLKYDRENAAQDLLDAPIPERDPFLSRDIYTVRGAKVELKESPVHRAVVKKSSVKKRSTTKKIRSEKVAASPVKVSLAGKKSVAKKKAGTQGASLSKSSDMTKTKAKPRPKPKPKAKPKAKVSPAKALKSAPARKKVVAKKKAKG